MHSDSSERARPRAGRTDCETLPGDASTVMLKIASRAADLLLVVLVAGVLILAALPHVAPRLGYDPLVIRGRSMTPAIALGSVVFVRSAPPSEVRAGDVVTIRADNGVVFTHRVVEVVSSGGDVLFRTKGDANEAADPTLVPGHAVKGRVEASLPGLGYAMLLASRPSGMASMLAFGILLFLFGRFADGLRQGDDRRRSVPAAVPG